MSNLNKQHCSLIIFVSFSRAQETGDIGIFSFSSGKARRFVLTADEAEECFNEAFRLNPEILESIEKLS